MDSVAKVSAIIQSGTHKINGQIPVSHTYQDSSGWQEKTTHESYSATQQSTLASKLMPPQKPFPQQHFLYRMFTMSVFLFFGFIALQALITLGEAIQGIHSNITYIILGVVALPISIFALLWVWKTDVKLQAPYKEKSALALKAWEYSITRWNELYYCSRDNCVFIPNEGKAKAFDITRLNEAIDWYPQKW